MTPTEFNQLLHQRLTETQSRIPVKLKLTWDFGMYPHFQKPRGFAVTFIDSQTSSPYHHTRAVRSTPSPIDQPKLHMRFSHKMLSAPVDRVDAIIRHEIGHAVDAICSDADVLELARRHAPFCVKQSLFCRYVPESATAELRADAIAEYIWGQPIRYDEQEIQSLTRGAIGRPKHLGY